MIVSRSNTPTGPEPSCTLFTLTDIQSVVSLLSPWGDNKINLQSIEFVSRLGAHNDSEIPDERTKRMGADATSCQPHTGQSEFFVPVLRLQTLKKIDFIPIYIDRALTTSRSLSLRHSHFQTGWQPYLLCLAVFRLFTGLITNSNRLPTQTVTLVPVWGVLNLSSGYRHSIFPVK